MNDEKNKNYSNEDNYDKYQRDKNRDGTSKRNFDNNDEKDPNGRTIYNTNKIEGYGRNGNKEDEKDPYERNSDRYGRKGDKKDEKYPYRRNVDKKDEKNRDGRNQDQFGKKVDKEDEKDLYGYDDKDNYKRNKDRYQNDDIDNYGRKEDSEVAVNNVPDIYDNLEDKDFNNYSRTPKSKGLNDRSKKDDLDNYNDKNRNLDNFNDERNMNDADYNSLYYKNRGPNYRDVDEINKGINKRDNLDNKNKDYNLSNDKYGDRDKFKKNYDPYTDKYGNKIEGDNIFDQKNKKEPSSFISDLIISDNSDITDKNKKYQFEDEYYKNKFQYLKNLTDLICLELYDSKNIKTVNKENILERIIELKKKINLYKSDIKVSGKSFEQINDKIKFLVNENKLLLKKKGSYELSRELRKLERSLKSLEKNNESLISENKTLRKDFLNLNTKSNLFKVQSGFEKKNKTFIYNLIEKNKELILKLNSLSRNSSGSRNKNVNFKNLLEISKKECSDCQIELKNARKLKLEFEKDNRYLKAEIKSNSQYNKKLIQKQNKEILALKEKMRSLKSDMRSNRHIGGAKCEQEIRLEKKIIELQNLLKIEKKNSTKLKLEIEGYLKEKSVSDISLKSQNNQNVDYYINKIKVLRSENTQLKIKTSEIPGLNKTIYNYEITIQKLKTDYEDLREKLRLLRIKYNEVCSLNEQYLKKIEYYKERKNFYKKINKTLVIQRDENLRKVQNLQDTIEDWRRANDKKIGDMNKFQVKIFICLAEIERLNLMINSM